MARRRSTSEIAHAIARKLGTPGLPDLLARIASGSQLRSLLMHAMRERARRVTAPALLREARERAVFAPSPVDARELHRVEQGAFAAADGFDAIDVGPVQPLGTSWVLGKIDPNSVMSTIAGAEIAGDPTSALVYTAADRRAARAQVVRLCTGTRVMRLQPFDNPSFTPHFRIFALVSAGRDTGNEAFEHAELRRHITVYLRFLADLAGAGYLTSQLSVRVSDTRFPEALARAAGIELEDLRRGVRAHAPVDGPERFAALGVTAVPARVTEPRVELADLAARYNLVREVERLTRMHEQVLDPLRAAHPDVAFAIDPARVVGSAYYTSYAFHVEVHHPTHGPIPLADGGVTDWTARLLGNRKERMLASGIGTELIPRVFAAEQ